MKIVHIITGLNDGGAEEILYKICLHDKLNNHIVISVVSGGKYVSLLKKLGVKVYCLNMKFYSFFNFFYLIKLLKILQPDIVQTWLIHGDFIGGIAARFAGIKNILWTIPYSKVDTSIEKIRNILLIKILAKLSYIIPKLILVISKSGKKNCQNLGYYEKKLRLVTTGYDLFFFKRNRYEKLYFKKKLKIEKQTPLLGIVARYHPVKDHTNLLNALSIVKLKNKNFICIFVGSGMTKNNKILLNEIRKLELDSFVKLLGPKSNIPQVMNGLDVNILCSKSEGFPNVVVEAMACGTPCVVTNVGDSSFIVGKNGWVVPPSNSIKLANAIEKALSEINSKNWKKKCSQARLRVHNKFEIKKMIKYYNLTWLEVCNNKF